MAYATSAQSPDRCCKMRLILTRKTLWNAALPGYNDKHLRWPSHNIHLWETDQSAVPVQIM